MELRQLSHFLGGRRRASLHTGGGAGAPHAIEPVELRSRARARTWQRPVCPQYTSGRADRGGPSAAPRCPADCRRGRGRPRRCCRGPWAGARTPGDRCHPVARSGQPARAGRPLSPQASGRDAEDPSPWRARARATHRRWGDRPRDRRPAARASRQPGASPRQSLPNRWSSPLPPTIRSLIAVAFV